MDEKKKKKYVIPEALVISFTNDDIITASGDQDEWWLGGDNGEWWVD